MCINTLAVNAATKGSFSQTSADRRSNFIDGNGIIERTFGTVGESNNRHDVSFFSGDPYERSRDFKRVNKYGKAKSHTYDCAGRRV
jgi:hypothetical protein